MYTVVVALLWISRVGTPPDARWLVEKRIFVCRTWKRNFHFDFKTTLIKEQRAMAKVDPACLVSVSVETLQFKQNKKHWKNCIVEMNLLVKTDSNGKGDHYTAHFGTRLTLGCHCSVSLHVQPPHRHNPPSQATNAGCCAWLWNYDTSLLWSQKSLLLYFADCCSHRPQMPAHTGNDILPAESLQKTHRHICREQKLVRGCHGNHRHILLWVLKTGTTLDPHFHPSPKISCMSGRFKTTPRHPPAPTSVFRTCKNTKKNALSVTVVPQYSLDEPSPHQTTEMINDSEWFHLVVSVMKENLVVFLFPGSLYSALWCSFALHLVYGIHMTITYRSVCFSFSQSVLASCTNFGKWCFWWSYSNQSEEVGTFAVKVHEILQCEAQARKENSEPEIMHELFR